MSGLQNLLLGGGGISTNTIQIQDEGVSVTTNADFINFVGDDVNVTPNSTGVDVNISATQTLYRHWLF